VIILQSYPYRIQQYVVTNWLFFNKFVNLIKMISPPKFKIFTNLHNNDSIVSKCSLKVPSLNTGTLPRNNQMVRFRGMIQDIFNPEYYLGLFEQRNVKSGEKVRHYYYYYVSRKRMLTGPLSRKFAVESIWKFSTLPRV